MLPPLSAAVETTGIFLSLSAIAVCRFPMDHPCSLWIKPCAAAGRVCAAEGAVLCHWEPSPPWAGIFLVQCDLTQSGWELLVQSSFPVIIVVGSQAGWRYSLPAQTIYPLKA